MSPFKGQVILYLSYSLWNRRLAAKLHGASLWPVPEVSPHLTEVDYLRYAL